MPTHIEGELEFHFKDNHLVERVDQWEPEPLLNPRPKAVDFAVCRMSAKDDRYWLLEVKDYRVLRGQPKASSLLEMAGDFLAKLSGSETLIKLQAQAGHDGAVALRAKQVRIPVLHMELPPAKSRISPFPKSLQANLWQKLRQEEANCLVFDIGPTKAVPWSVTSTTRA